MTRMEFIEFATSSNAEQKQLRIAELKERQDFYIKSASAFVIRVTELLKENGYKMKFFFPQSILMAKYRFTWADIVLVDTSTRIFCIDDYKTFGDDTQLNNDVVMLAFETNAVNIKPDDTDEEILLKIKDTIAFEKSFERIWSETCNALDKLESHGHERN